MTSLGDLYQDPQGVSARRLLYHKFPSRNGRSSRAIRLVLSFQGLGRKSHREVDALDMLGPFIPRF